MVLPHFYGVAKYRKLVVTEFIKQRSCPEGFSYQARILQSQVPEVRVSYLVPVQVFLKYEQIFVITFKQLVRLN